MPSIPGGFVAAFSRQTPRVRGEDRSRGDPCIASTTAFVSIAPTVNRHHVASNMPREARVGVWVVDPGTAQYERGSPSTCSAM